MTTRIPPAREHLLYSGIWINKPRYEVEIDGKKYGFHSLSPERIKNGVMNRIADSRGWSFLSPEEWTGGEPVVFRRYGEDGISGELALTMKELEEKLCHRNNQT